MSVFCWFPVDGHSARRARWWPALWLLCAGWLAAALASPGAWAQDAGLLQQAWLRDAGGQRGFDAVRGATFTPYSGMLTRGFDDQAVYWLRLRVPASEAPTGAWVLRLQPSWHDDLRLYDTAEPSPVPREAGDRHPWSASEFQSLSHAFRLPRLAAARDVFVRVQSVHSYQISAELLEHADAERSEWRRTMLLSVYVSAMVLVLLWAVSALLLRRDLTLGVFSAAQLAAVLFALQMSGMARVILDGLVSNRLLDHAHALTVIGYTLVSLLFYTLLLRNSGARRWANALTLLLSLAPAVALALYAAGMPSRALALNSAAVAAFSVAMFVVCWLGLPADDQPAPLLPRGLLRAFSVPLFLVGLWWAFPLLGWVQASGLSLLVFVLHGPLMTSVLGAVLVFRAQQRIKHQAGEVALATAQAQRQRLAREEQSQFMAMINHEVKNPLGVLKMLLAGQPIQGRAEAQVDAVVGLLDRCLLYDQLSAGQSQRGREPMQPDAVVQQCIDRSGAPVRFSVNLQSTQPLQSDPVLYGVIVSNLLDNALKYALRDSTIVVELHHAERGGVPSVCLAVTNLIGRAGVPDPDRRFGKYYRAEAARSIPGTGLGLFLVKSFATMLGGDVTCVVQRPNIRFEVCLPL